MSFKIVNSLKIKLVCHENISMDVFTHNLIILLNICYQSIYPPWQPIETKEKNLFNLVHINSRKFSSVCSNSIYMS